MAASLFPENTFYVFQTKTIIIIAINKQDYNYNFLICFLFLHLKSLACPCCGKKELKLFGMYNKYYYSELIPIQRVRCPVCGKTHALIPEFSLPHTSIGTKEAEEYLKTNNKKIYRAVFSKKGMSGRYTESLHKTLSRCMLRAKVLFAHRGDQTQDLRSWFLSAFGGNTPILDCNRQCLSRKYNPVFCSRITILLFKKNSAPDIRLHNNDLGQPYDSG